MTPKPLPDFLLSSAERNLLPWSRQVAAAEQYQVSLAEVEEMALGLGLLPTRYQRNQQTFNVYDQLRLFRSRVAIVGCGGLGGYVIEELARLGVGHLRVIDPDTVEEHNLNRQLLCTPATLGRYKVELAAERVAQVNPAVRVRPFRMAYTPEFANDLLGGVDVVVDALDSIPTRLALSHSCSYMGLPLVHGAIAGWYGHLCAQFPGDHSIQALYGSHAPEKGIEARLGNPSFTPAVVASLEAAEVCKILLRVGVALRGRWLVINLFDMTFDEIAIPTKGE